MRIRLRGYLVIFFAFTFPTCAQPAAVTNSVATNNSSGPLVLTQTIALPNVEGGLNHMVVAAKIHKAFIPAPIQGTVEVVDLDSGKRVRSLTGEKPSSVRYSSEFNELYITRAREVLILDASSLQLLTNVDVHTGLNEIHYDGNKKLLYAGCINVGKSGIAVVDLATRTLKEKIDLPAKPMGFAIEWRAGRILANMPTLGQVGIIDLNQHKLIGTWTLSASANYAIALDEPIHRAFVGCRTPPCMLALDLADGRVVGKVPIDRDSDDLFFDPEHHFIYISCGGGHLEVVEQKDPDTYRLVQEIHTGERARTCFYSGVLKKLFVAVPAVGEHHAELQVYEVKK